RRVVDGVWGACEQVGCHACERFTSPGRSARCCGAFGTVLWRVRGVWKAGADRLWRSAPAWFYRMVNPLMRYVPCWSRVILAASARHWSSQSRTVGTKNTVRLVSRWTSGWSLRMLTVLASRVLATRSAAWLTATRP